MHVTKTKITTAERTGTTAAQNSQQAIKRNGMRRDTQVQITILYARVVLFTSLYRQQIISVPWRRAVMMILNDTKALNILHIMILKYYLPVRHK